MERDPKTLSATETLALIRAGWDGVSPIPHLTDEELAQMLDDALGRSMHENVQPMIIPPNPTPYIKIK